MSASDVGRGLLDLLAALDPTGTATGADIALGVATGNTDDTWADSFVQVFGVPETEALGWGAVEQAAQVATGDREFSSMMENFDWALGAVGLGGVPGQAGAATDPAPAQDEAQQVEAAAYGAAVEVYRAAVIACGPDASGFQIRRMLRLMGYPV